MSATLYWYPVVPPKGHALPDQLRFVLQKDRGWEREWKIDVGHRGYFEGLRDAGIEGAQAVLDALDKHDTIILELR